MDYNALGQPTRLALGNGRTTTYEYEPDSFRLARLTTDGGLQDLSYRYDAAGNVVAFFDGVAGLDLSYEYDFLDRLVGVGGTYTRTYAYDLVGNLTNKAGITQFYADPAHVHAVTGRSDGKSYAYDPNGNMTNRAGQALTWDAQNRLTEVVSGTTTVRFAYDGQGQRVKKEVVGGETTIYIGPHLEKNVTTGQVTAYYYANGRPVAMRQGGAVYYLHGDHLGSIGVVSDESGQEVGRASYYPFGELYTGTGALPTDRLFTGQRLDETGLYQMGARWYDFQIGRWLSADTIIPEPWNPQSLNRYSYVGNNSLRFVDPTGYARLWALLSPPPPTVTPPPPVATPSPKPVPTPPVGGTPTVQELQEREKERMLREISTTYWGAEAVQYAQSHGWDIRLEQAPEGSAGFTKPWPWKDVIVEPRNTHEATRGRLIHELMHVWLYRGTFVDSIEQEYVCDFYTAVIQLHLGSLSRQAAGEWFGGNDEYITIEERYEDLQTLSVWHSKLPVEQPTGLKVVWYAVIQGLGYLRGEMNQRP